MIKSELFSKSHVDDDLDGGAPHTHYALTDAVHSLVAVAAAALVRVDEVGARLGGWTRTRHALVDICYTHRSMIEPQKKAKHTTLPFM